MRIEALAEPLEYRVEDRAQVDRQVVLGNRRGAHLVERSVRVRLGASEVAAGPDELMPVVRRS